MFYINYMGAIVIVMSVFFIAIIITAIAIFATYQFKEEEKARIKREKLEEDRRNNASNLNRVSQNKKEVASRKRVENKKTTTTTSTSNRGVSTLELELKNKEIALKKREEELNDKEMALAEGLEEILALKEKVDAIIKAQQEELFSYCSVSEESALKMKEVILEVQIKLKETVEKIQE